MEKIVYLVRHCSTTGQEPDAPLTEEGFQQAEALAEWFEGVAIDRIVSSPYARASQSVKALSRKTSVAIQHDARLVERCVSTEPIEDVPAAVAAAFEDLDLRFPGGETSGEAMARAMAALEDILASESGTTVLVTHGNLLALLLKHFDPAVGYETQRALTNPDVFLLQQLGEETTIARVLGPRPY